MTKDSVKIGLLDSGVGGLSVLKQLKRIMPEKNYIFFGDTKNVPYGTKTPEEIYGFTKNILDFFITKNVKYVVIACNTTSAVAYERLRENFRGKLTIIPLIQSAAKSAIEGLYDGDTVAVFATRATINSKKYSKCIKEINPKINTEEIDCTGFVEIVENRLYDTKDAQELIKEKLGFAKGAKRIILGCTHYPYLVSEFRKYLDIEYFDPAIAAAKTAREIIKDDAKGSEEEFFVSSNPEKFMAGARVFYEVKNAKLIEL